MKFKTVTDLALATAILTLSACAKLDTKTTVMNEPNNSSVGIIKVDISGLKAQKGIVNVALFDKENYPDGELVRGQEVKVSAETISMIFENIPSGEYGLRMYHDVDGNGELNSNKFGIPSEPYAFSNNAKGRMGPAKWDQIRFNAQGVETVQAITLN